MTSPVLEDFLQVSHFGVFENFMPAPSIVDMWGGLEVVRPRQLPVGMVTFWRSRKIMWEQYSSRFLGVLSGPGARSRVLLTEVV